MKKTIINNILHSNYDNCIALAEHNGLFYYAVSGDDDPSDSNLNEIASEIERMVGVETINRCIINNSFTKLGCFSYPDFVAPNIGIYYSDFYKEVEKRLYKNLRKLTDSKYELYCLFPELLDVPQTYANFVAKNLVFSPRLFSCVERKIIGTIGTNNIKIIVAKRPCYLCLPTISDVIYRDSHKNYELFVRSAFQYKTISLKLKHLK